jgi:6-pyruvoyltetrahydropterin/6-carboxytetrahydropterin synthase
MTHRITRTHEIDAGHRVAGHRGKCAHFHGHRYGFSLTCEAPRLDELGMVIDFAVLKDKLCAWLDGAWDHRMLLWVHDPLIETMRDLDPDGVVAVPFNPTAENIARYLVEIIGPQQLHGTGVKLVACTVQETAKCSAIYTTAL